MNPTEKDVISEELARAAGADAVARAQAEIEASVGADPLSQVLVALEVTMTLEAAATGDAVEATVAHDPDKVLPRD